MLVNDELTNFIVSELYLMDGINWDSYPKDLDFVMSNDLKFDHDNTLNAFKTEPISFNYTDFLCEIIGKASKKSEYRDAIREIIQKNQGAADDYLDDKIESWVIDLKGFVEMLKRDHVNYEYHLEACKLAADKTIPVTNIQNTLLDLERMGFAGNIGIVSAGIAEAIKFHAENKLQILGSNCVGTELFKNGHLIDNPKLIMGEVRRITTEESLAKKPNSNFHYTVLVDDDYASFVRVASNIGIKFLVVDIYEKEYKKEKIDKIKKKLTGNVYKHLPELRKDSRKLVEWLKKDEKGRIFCAYKTAQDLKDIIDKIRYLKELESYIKKSVGDIRVPARNFYNAYDFVLKKYHPVFPEETLYARKYLEKLNFIQDPSELKKNVVHLMDLLEKYTPEYHATDDFYDKLLSKFMEVR
jgi:hypothetical protein